MSADRSVTWRRLLVALMLLVLAVVLYVTNPPEKSPVETVTTAYWTLYYDVFPADEPGLESIHESPILVVREQCVACHDDKTGSELPVHRIHLGSELLEGLACEDCHRHVDLASRGATTAVNWVDVGFCKECHSAFPDGCSESHLEEHTDDIDCMECHTGEQAARHDQPYLPKDIDPSECLGCHGGRVLPWTPLHEREDWLDLHGPEGLEAGAESCFACHDFGLKFCDECHGEKPPSHIPEDDWLDRHIEVASSDTRVCYTCHETSYCKGCHVNHEEGWMDSHPGFVDESGDESCKECHSSSSCTFCHIKDPVSPGDTAPVSVPSE